jgi:hypothetical protein
MAADVDTTPRPVEMVGTRSGCGVTGSQVVTGSSGACGFGGS